MACFLQSSIEWSYLELTIKQTPTCSRLQRGFDKYELFCFGGTNIFRQYGRPNSRLIPHERAGVVGLSIWFASPISSGVFVSSSLCDNCQIVFEAFSTVVGKELL